MSVTPKPTDGFEWTQAPWGSALRCRPLLEVAPHLFSTANLQLKEDAREWNLVASALGVPPDRVLLVRQVHRAGVAIARRGRPGEWIRPEADVIISDDPSAAIGVRIADCAPILIADRRRSAVAAAHAGWRGTVQRVAMSAVRALTTEFGSDPADLVAAVGPCLGPCCAEVGSEVVDAFRDAGHGEGDLDTWFRTGASGRPYLDLWMANRRQLEAAGVRPDNVHVAGLCTKTHAGLLHSYRVTGERAGRMVGVIRAG
jgi:YfiH family protein